MLNRNNFTIQRRYPGPRIYYTDPCWCLQKYYSHYTCETEKIPGTFFRYWFHWEIHSKITCTLYNVQVLKDKSQTLLFSVYCWSYVSRRFNTRIQFRNIWIFELCKDCYVPSWTVKLRTSYFVGMWVDSATLLLQVQLA